MEIQKRYDSVVAPDFSQLVGMAYPQRMYHCYLNRAFARYWHQNGINVIPNITWSTPDSYAYSFIGVKKRGIIAINSMGIKHSPTSKYLWLRGYKEAISIIEPSVILRYGDKIEGENESRSVYFPNVELDILRNGR